jgi:hypothetical protein
VVAPQSRRLDVRQRLVVDQDDVGVVDVDRRRGQHRAVDLDPAVGDPAFGVAARAQAGARQALGDALGTAALLEQRGEVGGSAAGCFG